MKRTPFHERTRARNRMQMWFNWDLHVVPDVYSDFGTELRATRSAVSMGDMSPLSKYEIEGPDALRFIDRVVTRDVSRLEVGQVVYTPWTDERGKVVGDGLIFRLDEDLLRLTTDPQSEWLARLADGFDVAISDRTDDFGLLAIQGPRSADLMEALTGESWRELSFSRTRTTSAANAELLVARQGFTGELGYELWVPRQAGPDVWDAVAAAGEPFGILPAGEYAIDVARVEAGLLIVGADYTGAGPDRPGSVIELSPANQASPYELGLGGFVELGGQDFVGREALAAEEAAGGPPRRLAGLELDHTAIVALAGSGGRPPMMPNRVWWYPLEVTAGGRPIGRATSVTWAPTIERVVGFGHLEAEHAAAGNRLEVRWNIGDVDGAVPATVVELPFLKHRRTG